MLSATTLRFISTACCLACLLIVGSGNALGAGAARQVWLDELDLQHMTAGYGRPKRNLSLDGKPLTLGGSRFERGVGTHGPSFFRVRLDGGATRFSAVVGVDDEAGKRGSVEFIVGVDGKERWRSGVMEGGSTPKPVSVPLRGANELTLRVTDGGDGGGYDHADWADASLTVTGGAPEASPATREFVFETANSALAYVVADDGRLYQTQFGARRGDRAGIESGREAYPQYGNGWLFEPALQVTHGDGNTSTDLRWDGIEVRRLGEVDEETRILLRDSSYRLSVALAIRRYPKEDVFEQWVEVRHSEKGPVTLSQFASSAPVIGQQEWWLTQFHGDYLSEMQPSEEKLTFGSKVLESKLGVRAHYYSHPAFLLANGGPAREETGEVIAGTLAWSGNYRFTFEVDPGKRLRAICGMNPFASRYRLKPGEVFRTPSMIWSWSSAGKGGVSRNLHRWARKYGMRERKSPRPVVLNNWEATYFDFDEPKLNELLDAAKPLGLELFLLDDGWFGNKYPRNDDRAGLGDWEPNRKKLPNGISALVEASKRRGMRFGLWVEPEMVNPRSELFEKHPEWVIRQPKRELNLFRNQLVLDLTRPQVREFVFKTVDDVLTRNPGIEFIKWDCNRYVTQPGSPYLGAGEQSHLWIDYVRALYGVLDRIAERHPNVEIMLCSGGAGRVDYGSLRYGHEFWASDNTDPLARIKIQWGYSHFFPASAMGAHVTHMGNRPLKFAFDVAMSGNLGMDLDLRKLSEADKVIVKRAITDYKTVRGVVEKGDLYRLESPYEGSRTSLMYVAADRGEAVVFAYQTKDGEPAPLRLRGLDPGRTYRVQELNQSAGTPNLAGDAFMGADLNETGIVLPLRRQFDSVVFRLSEVRGRTAP